MTSASRLDACRDAAALLRAAADRDREGIDVILDYSDNREVCEVLAALVLIAITPHGPDFLAELCGLLRDNDHQEDEPA
jgi:hypothetical protein